MQYLDQIARNQLPIPRNAERTTLGRNLWTERIEKLDDPELRSGVQQVEASDAGTALLDAVFANSPFLTHALVSDIGTFLAVLKALERQGSRRSLDQLRRRGTLDGTQPSPPGCT